MEERGRRKRQAGVDLSTARIGKEVQSNAFKSVVQSEQTRQECRRTSCNNLDPQLVGRRESSLHKQTHTGSFHHTCRCLSADKQSRILAHTASRLTSSSPKIFTFSILLRFVLVNVLKRLQTLRKAGQLRCGWTHRLSPTSFCLLKCSLLLQHQAS